MQGLVLLGLFFGMWLGKTCCGYATEHQLGTRCAFGNGRAWRDTYAAAGHAAHLRA